ncbi:DUF5067 domain-containing protein [Mammaliicoccus sciuri]
MKKILTLMLAAGLLAACGNDEPKDETAGSTPAKETSEQKPEPENKTDNGIYFKDGVAKIEDVKIEITDTKVIPTGEKGNEYGDKPVFAIWYKATNFTEKEIDPGTAWIAIFTAIQDNDPNMVNKLEVGMLPDETHLDTQMNTIKKDGTVENSIAYELDDLETPVTLVATQGIAGDKIGEQTFEIK